MRGAGLGASYSAGAGLTLTGTTFAVDTASVQARVASTCPAGSGTCPADEVIRGVNTDGTVTCGGATSGWLARSSGGVGQTAAWTSIPGLWVTIDLPRAARVSLLAVGTQRHQAGNCHVGYRYVVDGVARGDASWGQQLQVSGPNSWHAGFTVHDFETLGAGTHTVSVQARNVDTSNWCYICLESGGTASAYDDCTLDVTAYYE